ncbi:MAG: hypothetical protein ACTSU4_08250 [Promethearchaeota archaeon]
MSYHVIKTWSLLGKSRVKKFNEILYVLLTLGFGMLYPFMLLKFADQHQGVFLGSALEEFIIIGNTCIFGLFIFIILLGFLNKFKTRKDPPQFQDFQSYEQFCKKFLENYDRKNTIRRKYSHLIPGAVVIVIILICYFLQPILKGAWRDYAYFIIIIIGIDFALAFLLEDLIRLLAFNYMPNFAVKLCKAGLYSDELDTFSSTFVMVFSFGPFIFFSFPIFFIILLISSIADAMSSIIGIQYSHKNHYFPKNGHKTIEGYLSGFFFSFFSAFIAILFSNVMGYSQWSLSLSIMVSLIASFTFFFIDMLTSIIKLQDNILNPFGVGIALLLFLSFLNISIY